MLQIIINHVRIKFMLIKINLKYILSFKCSKLHYALHRVKQTYIRRAKIYLTCAIQASGDSVKST